MYRPLYNNAEKFQIYKKFPWFLACSLFEGNAQLRPIIYLFVSPRSASQLHIRFGLTETQRTWPNRFLMCVCVVFVLCLCCFLYSVIFYFFFVAQSHVDFLVVCMHSCSLFLCGNCQTRHRMHSCSCFCFCSLLLLLSARRRR